MRENEALMTYVWHIAVR